MITQIISYGITGQIRGELGKWKGGLAVGFLGGLSLGLKDERLIYFTALTALACSQGYGKYINAVQTGKRPVWGWLQLLKVNFLYLMAGIVLPDFQPLHLGWGLAAWPIGMGADKFAKKYLPTFDGWKVAENVIMAIIGLAFFISCKSTPPIQEFPLVVYLISAMTCWKYMISGPYSSATAMTYILLPIIIHICLILGL